jgi:hypothetical protein
VVRVEDLRCDVVLVEAEPGWAHGESPHGFAGGQPLENRNEYLDHEAATRFQVGGDVTEARNLLVLCGQVCDRVVHEIGESERLVEVGGGEVADRDADIVGARLRLQPADHGRRDIEPVHANATATERQSDTAGADAQLECISCPSEISEKAHSRVDHRGLEHVG